MKIDRLFLEFGVLALSGCGTASSHPSGGGAPDAGAATADLALADATADASGATDGGPTDSGLDGDAGRGPDAGSVAPQLPLHTSGRWIVDARGRRVKLAAVNWYGADQQDFVVGGLDRVPLAELAASIRRLGFNAVRLPWSNELVERDPPVAAGRLSANPALVGLTGMQLLDAAVAALAHENLLIILDNHVSRADWCCSGTDGNQLWYHEPDYPEAHWISDWQALARRYRDQPQVVGADLRNEPRLLAMWGGAGVPAAADWSAAAERGGNAVLAVNPDLLIIVEGTDYAQHLQGARQRPIVLSAPGHLVYEAHDYPWFHQDAVNRDPQTLRAELLTWWGFLLEEGHPWTAPVWLGEFGACNTAPACVDGDTPEGRWLRSLLAFMTEQDLDFGYWPLNGTHSSGNGVTLDALESYGILDTTWRAPSLPALLEALQSLQPRRLGPA